MNFISIPIFSFVPTKYRELTKESGGKIFGGLLVFFILMGIISGAVWASRVGELTSIVESDCPDFELANGKFTIERPFHFDSDGVYMDIDPSIQSATSADIEAIRKKGSYQTVMIIGSNGFASYNNGQVQEYGFDTFKDFAISKTTLVNSIFPAIKAGVFICLLIGSFLSIGIYYLVAVILQYLTGLIAKSFFSVELAEQERFRTTVLGKFPPHVLIFVLKLVGVPIGFIANLLMQLAFIAVCVYFYKKTGEEEESVVEMY